MPNYLDPAVLSRITRMDLRARLVVEGFISGMHRSPYHGFSVEFAQHREYVPGDPINHVDWKVWARADRFYLKQYEEETNLRCTLLLDCSRSMAYGGGNGRGMSKLDYGATVAACLAYMLQHQQDAVGLVLFDREVRRDLAPSSHPRQLKQILHELETVEPDRGSDVAGVFPLVASRARRRGMVIVISDLFFDLDALRSGLSILRHRRHDVMLLHLLHQDEISFPFQDNTLFRDLEGEARLLVEPAALRRSYLRALEDFIRNVRRVCSKTGVDYVSLDTGKDLGAALAGYLASRRRLEHTYGKR